jgi:hypothetical protein
LWIAGLVLQSLLLLVLFRRRVVRLFPVFSCLIAFYVARSALFYVLAKPPAASHRELFNFLSLVDLFLQIVLVIEIAVRSFASQATAKDRPWSRLALQLAIEAVMAAAIAMLVPEPTRVRVDRGVLFVTLLMMLRLVWMARHRFRGIPLLISAGFALYGVMVTATAIVQNMAAESRDMVEFTAASYINAVVYLGIVLFWIVGVLRAPLPGSAVPAPRSLGKQRRAERAGARGKATR